MFTKAHSSLVFNAVHEENLGESENSLRQVIMKYFNYGSSLGLIVSNHVETGNRFTKMHQPVFVFNFYNNSIDCCSQSLDFQGYVFVTSCSNSSLEDQTLPTLDCFSHNSSQQLRSKQILIVYDCLEKDSYDSKHNFNSYLKFLWEFYGLINVVIFPVLKNTEIISKSVITYNPFIVGDTLTSRLIEADVDKDFVKFFQKRFKNMNGYKIKGSDLDNFNIKGAVFNINFERKNIYTSKFFRKTLEYAFNITVTVLKPISRLKSALSPNLITSVSLLDDVNNNMVDVALIPQLINSAYQNIQYLTAKSVEPLVILVKKPLPIRSWQFIFYTFKKDLWFTIGFAYTILCTSAIFLSKFQVSKKRRTRRDKTSLDLLRVCSNALLTKPFRKTPTANSERLLLGLCLWLGFVVNSTLLGRVINFMNYRPEPPSVDTFEDLENSDIHIYYDEPEFYNMEFLANTSLGRLGKRLHFGLPPDNNSDEKIGTICFEISAEMKMYCQPSLYGKLHIMNQRVVSLPLFYIMPKGSVLFEHFDLLFSKLHEAGFFVYWEDTYYNELCLSRLKKSQKVFKMGSAKVLFYKDLTIPFYALYIGLTLSVICFILEIVSSKPFQVVRLFDFLISKNRQHK